MGYRKKVTQEVFHLESRENLQAFSGIHSAKKKPESWFSNWLSRSQITHSDSIVHHHEGGDMGARHLLALTLL